VAPPSAPPPPPTPFKTKPLNVGGSEEQPEEGTLRESDPHEDDPEDSMSLAAIEAELKPKVLETFDAIADTFKRLRRLQDQDIHNKSAGAGAQVQEARSIEHDSPLKSLACFRSK
jgi:RNA polymerase primary sigma factor